MGEFGGTITAMLLGENPNDALVWRMPTHPAGCRATVTCVHKLWFGKIYLLHMSKNNFNAFNKGFLVSVYFPHFQASSFSLQLANLCHVSVLN